MKYYRCVKEKTNENDCCAIYFDGETYSVGFAYTDFDFPRETVIYETSTSIVDDELLEVTNEDFANVDFVAYEKFHTDEDAMRSIINGGFPFGNINAIPEEN